jgi:hypothetical protein
MILINQRQPPITLETPHVFNGLKNHFVYFLLHKSAAVPVYHRVDRVQAFSPVVHIGTPPPPHPQASVSLPPLWLGGAHSPGGKRLGGSQFRRGDRHCGTLGKYVLFALYLSREFR